MKSNSSHQPLPSARVPSKRSYPHIQDLIARTNGLNPNDRASIKSWLDQAQRHWHQSKSQLAFGSLDTALVDYLLAFTIVLSVIPSCREFPTFKHEAGTWYSQYETLLKALNDRHAEFERVKDEIKKDNAASGVLSVHQLAQQNGHAQKQTLRAIPTSGISEANDSEYPQSVTTTFKSPPITSTTPAGSDLHARFQHLRLNSLRSSLSDDSVDSNTHRVSPHGPRDMPRRLAPLEVNYLPQMPAPTYSPSTSFASPGGLSPPRSGSRGPVMPPRKLVPGPSTPLPLPNEATLSVERLFTLLRGELAGSVLLLDVRSREVYDQGHVFARSVACVEPITLRDGMSGDDLEQTFVLAPRNEQELFQRREQYDLVVYHDQSTATLDFLETTPVDDNQFGLRSLHFALYEYAYGQHRLRRRPLLLLGGIDAWIDLVGQQALAVTPSSSGGIFPRLASGLDGRPNVAKGDFPRRAPTSETSQRVPEYHMQSAPPLAAPRVYGNGNRNGAKPPYLINAEDEQRWKGILHSDHASAPAQAASQQKPDVRNQGNSISDSPISPGTTYPRSVEEFFQRYPAVSHGQESMSYAGRPSDGSFQPPSRQHTIIDHPFHGFTDVRNPEFHPPSPPVRPPPVLPRKSYSGVSERFAPPLRPLSATAPERPPKIAPYSSSFDSSFSRTENIGIATTGLKNLGNTCYMNSILQCMSGTIPLSRYFLDGSYKNHINKNNPLGSRGVLVEAFANIVRHLWSGEYKFVSPVTLKEVSGRLNEMFKTNDQQDAQEFLEFLLDGLHEDLNPNANRTKLNPLTEEEEQRRERMPSQIASMHEWNRYLHQNYSVIVNWLQGQLRSRLRCLTCGTTSTTYNPFMYLSLPIPTTKNGRSTLNDCLHEFVKEEILDKDDAWNCPNCKRPRRATKTLTIMRLPPILIIHIKRFTNRGPWRDKLNTFVDFPVKELDLTAYTPPLLPAHMQPSEIFERPETTPPFIYDLYGISNHYGTLNGGHYTAFVRSSYRGNWTLFDDSKASGMDESSVVSRNAYVLFWVRKNIM